MSNTGPLRFTATAGTKLVGATNLLISLLSQIPNFTTKRLLHLYNITGSNFLFIVQYSPLQFLLRIGLFSIPMWLYVLPNQLNIFSLVVFFTTNYLKFNKHDY